MIIKNDYFKLEIIDDKVIYNQNEIKYSSYQDLYGKMEKYLGIKKNSEIQLEGEYEPLNNVEQVVCLYLSNYHHNVYSIKYDVIRTGTKAFDTNMIVLADSVDYVVKDVSNNTDYENFYKKYGYCIRRGNKIFDIRNCNLEYTLEYWNNYCSIKHNKKFTKEAIDYYNYIYRHLGFNSIKLTVQDDTAASLVYFRDEDNRIIYCIIAGWNEKYRKYSPCIFMYSKIIEFCHNNNYKFSFCYGLQDYKGEMLKYFGDENEE